MPKHSLVLFTNNLPKIGRTDQGTLRRLIAVPFDAVIPDSKRIANFTDVLYSPLTGGSTATIITNIPQLIAAGSNYKEVIRAILCAEYRGKLCALIDMHCKIIASHEVGNIRFIIEPVLKEEGFTIDEMIQHLLQREVEDNNFSQNNTSASERSNLETGKKQ